MNQAKQFAYADSSSHLEPADNFSEQPSTMQEEETPSLSKQMFANRGKMTKKDVAMNIKAMLAKTKVGDSVTTSTSATTGNKKHWAVPSKKSTKSSNNTSVASRKPPVR